MKKLTSLFLSLLLLFSLTACGEGSQELAGAVLDAAIDAALNYEGDVDSVGVIGGADGPTAILVTGPDDSAGDAGSAAEALPFVPTEGGYYYDLENVVLYLYYYDTLPDNYITKSEARSLGWEGGTPERYLEASAIGGDSFGNREGLLPEGDYTECDLNTLGEDSRGAERLVFSDDGRYYHTEDHYASFTEVWVENGEVIWE